MKKLDLRRQYRHLYQPSARNPALVEVPELQFVMIDGRIEPGATPGLSAAFQQALAALYGISYTLKFMSKLRREKPVDYPVMALEALWWVEDGPFDLRTPGNWQWTAMMMQPEHITREMFREALAQLRRKRPSPALDQLRFKSFREGLCVQIMHVGPYADEPASLARLQAFASENGCRLRGRHHEIYLGDPRRADPARLKTVLRHPVRKTGR